MVALLLSIASLGHAEERGLVSRVKAWFLKATRTDKVDPSYLSVKNRVQWECYDYTSTCGFSAQFPNAPEHSGQVIEIPQSELTIRYDTYVSETLSDNTVYVVSVWEYPDKIDISRPELNLQEGFSGMLNALPESQVLLMKATEVQGHKALEFWIVCEDIYFRGLLISVNHTLYQIFMVYKSEDAKALDQEYDIFTKSFKITKIREAKMQNLKKKVRL